MAIWQFLGSELIANREPDKLQREKEQEVGDLLPVACSLSSNGSSLHTNTSL